jgi:Lon protease-like protein
MLLDLFPLNSVVFPHQTIPLRIFEPRYLKLIETCHREVRPFGICMIREGKEVGAPAIPFKVGTSVVIKEFTNISDNLFNIVVQGERRFIVEHFIQEQPHIIVQIEWIDRETPSFPGDYTVLRSITKDILKDAYIIPEDSNELFGFLGRLITMLPTDKQEILELPVEKVVPALISLLRSI